MSASQYDDLLGQFGEDTSSSTKAGSNGAYDDIFDPYSSSQPGAEQDAYGDAEITNGNANTELDFEFGATTSTSSKFVDQHYNMSAENGSSNQLLDFESGPEEPYYGDEHAAQYSGQFDEDQSNSLNPNNVLCDFDNGEPAGVAATDGVDLLGNFNEQLHDDSNHVHADQQLYDDNDIIEDFEVLQKEDIVEQQIESERANGELDQAYQTEDQQFQDVDHDLIEQEEAINQEEDPVDHAPAEYASVEDAPVEAYDAPCEETFAETFPAEDAPVKENIPHPQLIPDVEITESPDQNFSDDEVVVEDVKNEPAVDVEATKQDAGQAEVCAYGGDVAEEAEHSHYHASSEHDNLVTDPFEHDRREKDLEHYCMDREESDLMEDYEHVPDQHIDSLKPRDQRSRSPSRSIGPDTQDVPDERYQTSETPEDTDATEDVDTLRPRDDRSHAPSRSLEPEDIPKTDEVPDVAGAGDSASRSENRYSNSGLDRTHISTDIASNQWSGDGGYGAQSEKQNIHSESPSVKAEPTSVPLSNQREAYNVGSESQQYTAEQLEEEEEEGVYENVPTKHRDDIARETTPDRSVGLPTTGTAQSLKEKFIQAQQEAAAPTRSKREITPPIHGAGGEYVSEPRGHIERYEGKADSGVFESQPVTKTDVITSNTPVEEARIESGFAKNTAAKFKELQNKSSVTPTSGKRDITPDRTGQVEYVSEPRGHIEHYEGRADSGVFESEPVVNPDVVRSGEEIREELPERGIARNLADKFRQITSEASSPSAGSRGKREITPDRTGRVEYVSEPRGQHLDDYETRIDAGVFENQPQRNADVITSETVAEEVVPERGYARNVAAKFKELETTVKSPPLSPGRRKEFTPPREDERFHQSGVIESTPDFKSDVIHSGDHLTEALPERGTAKNIAQKFRQLESDNKTPGSFKAKKEFTPPPGDAGVYENQPRQFHADYNRPPESGIIENQPLRRDDVVRGDEPPKFEVELPERGAAKNLVNKWKQLESEGTKPKSPGSGRQKEFTPPREEPRIAEQRKSPRTPMSPNGTDQLGNGSVHPSDLPGQYQPQNDPTIFESNPSQRTDVLRETDTDWTEGMPKKDTAKKMMAKFQHIQAEANKQPPGPISRKEPEKPRRTVRKVGRSKSMRAAIQAEKCGACEKTVYAMERLEMNKRVYHKSCFRCTHCKAVLTPKTFAINNEVIFCTTHYKQLFATKGNYDEGFGRSQHKKRWSSNPDLTKDVDQSDLS